MLKFTMASVKSVPIEHFARLCIRIRKLQCNNSLSSYTKHCRYVYKLKLIITSNSDQSTSLGVIGIRKAYC